MKSHKIKNKKRGKRFEPQHPKTTIEKARIKHREEQELEERLKRMKEAEESYTEYKQRFPSMGDTLLEWDYQEGRISKEVYDKCKEIG